MELGEGWGRGVFQESTLAILNKLQRTRISSSKLLYSAIRFLRNLQEAFSCSGNTFRAEGWNILWDETHTRLSCASGPDRGSRSESAVL
jgi:hypothetical protein